MRFSDLFEWSLDFSNSITLEILNFFKSGSDDTKGLWINLSSCKKLIDLGILRFKWFLNGFMFLLKNQVADTCLLMNFIYKSMELIKQFLTLSFKILELLETYFILPFNLLRCTIELGNAFLDFTKWAHNFIVMLFLLLKSDNLLICLVQWFNYLVVCFLLIHLFTFFDSVVSSQAW